MSRRRFLRRAAAVGGVAATALGLESVREAYAFVVTRQRLALPGLRRPLRAVMLSDLHLGPFIGERQLAGWVRATAELEPDLVLLVGDLVDHRYSGDLSEFRRWLPELQPPLGSVAVPGNHDRARYPDLAPWRRMLEDVGVGVLINQGRSVRDDLYLAGVDDLRESVADPAAALAGAPTGAARVLLSHNPDLIPELPAEPAARPDLLLAGHTHGGQICVPGYGAVVTGSAYGRRYASGWVPAPMPAFVGRGLGVAALPVRFACPAELVVLELSPA